MFPRPERAQAAQERGGAADRQAHEIAIVGAAVNDHSGLDCGENGALVLRHAQFGFDDGVGVERVVNG